MGLSRNVFPKLVQIRSLNVFVPDRRVLECQCPSLFSDKAPSIWDHFIHTQPHKIEDYSNGDVACDSYNQYLKDIEMADHLGLDYYRFSISWPRLLPEGFCTKISKDGKQYYDNLINGLLKKGVQPLVTLYHWDLPQKLQDLGGWANPEMSEWFADYADVVFSLYGDRVKLWITINEPVLICDFTYNSGPHAPGIDEPELGPYLCTKTVLMAHAKAYHIYNKKYKPLYKGKVSIANNVVYFGAKTDDDKEITDLCNQYSYGRYLHPVFSKRGGWPPSLVMFMNKISAEGGHPRSRLPSLSKREIELIRGTYDFFGLNYYTSRLVRKARANETSEKSPRKLLESRAIFEHYPNSTEGYPEPFSSYPEGLRNTINWVRKNYGEQNIIITENGYSSFEDDLNDYKRIAYIEKHLEQILLSIHEDGAKIFGYCYWSLMDNFEWTSGYTPKFGLYKVDFTDKNRKRTPRISSQYYSHVIKSRSIDSKKFISKSEDTL
uniref:Myrosinase 1-like n=1 Tax=Bombyx mori TaxID=7091 RepID=A0A8R2M595_BOMMO|nr:myrosinase 1 isoform X2 [Bombyx mori]